MVPPLQPTKAGAPSAHHAHQPSGTSKYRKARAIGKRKIRNEERIEVVLGAARVLYILVERI
jgi:hypothetical protein